MNKTDAKQQLMESLHDIQHVLDDVWVDKSLPDDWSDISHSHEVSPKKTRVTIRLDADMIRWFRATGPGYSTLINKILRTYWTALVTGHIKSHWTEAETTDRYREYLEKVLETHAERKG